MNTTMAEVYRNGSDEVKARLRDAFPAEELGIRVSQQEFDEFFLGILRKYRKNVRFITHQPLNRYEIFNENGDWLFDVNYNMKNPWFWYSQRRISPLFQEKFSISEEQINEMMIPVVEREFGMRGLHLKKQRVIYSVRWNGSSE